mmetsp:Transcript_21941/g.64820  ORF Transcript_21941/g.64820 Transcript_21941/m.64820 type:complete len:213 (+) Transcript_21941:363-1001(+)
MRGGVRLGGLSKGPAGGGGPLGFEVRQHRPVLQRVGGKGRDVRRRRGGRRRRRKQRGRREGECRGGVGRVLLRRVDRRVDEALRRRRRIFDGGGGGGGGVRLLLLRPPPLLRLDARRPSPLLLRAGESAPVRTRASSSSLDLSAVPLDDDDRPARRLDRRCRRRRRDREKRRKRKRILRRSVRPSDLCLPRNSIPGIDREGRIVPPPDYLRL